MTPEDEALAPIPHPIEIEFFSKVSNKTTKLINSSKGFKVGGANRWYEFDFIQPVYLTEIRVDTSGYSSWHKFEFEISHIDGSTHRESLAVENNVILLSLGKLSSGFRFRPDQAYLTKTDILRVVAVGFSLAEFHEYEAILKNLRARAAKIAEKEEAYSSLEETETQLRDSVEKLTSEVGKLTAQRTEISDAMSSLSSQIKRPRGISERH